ncbi:MAG: toll/interleukin-1 receptor domain-containing protein [Gemmatimonadota bacterium]|nr:toll/interleukin-1 receptor domain-containing protein [Gemmatimonadota bacterium]
MYLASFDVATGGSIRQGALELRCLPPTTDAVREAWWAQYERIVATAGAVAGDVALRVSLTAGGLLDRVHLVSSPAAREAGLRRYLASFTRLDLTADGSTRLPATREEYDAIVDDVPPLQCRARAAGFRRGGVWFASDFRIAPFLDDLIAEADTLGFRLTYQVNVSRGTITADRVGDARKNALRVRDLAGVPAALPLLQSRLATHLPSATAVCEELIAVDTSDAATWLSEAMRRHFLRGFGEFGFDAPHFEFIDHGYSDWFDAPSSSPAPSELPLDELCASAVDDTEGNALLGTRPSNDIAARFAGRVPLDPTGGEAPAPLVWTPPPGLPPLPVAYAGAHDFIFISYKHDDIPRIAPVMAELGERGQRIWYDSGIPGGAEWDAMIEERIARCRVLLLFVSQSAVASKYVRREVKFADSLGKPIISVALENAHLTHGMRMLLSQYQMLNGTGDGLHDQLESAFRHLA